MRLDPNTTQADDFLKMSGVSNRRDSSADTRRLVGLTLFETHVEFKVFRT